MRRVALIGGLLLAVLGLTASTVYAAPGDDGQVHGCAGEVGGYLRAIEDEQSCISTETAVTWAVSGFVDWVLVEDEIPLSDTDQGVDKQASCDYENGYRLIFAVASHSGSNAPSAQPALAPYRLLHEAADGKPTGVVWRVSSQGFSGTVLSYQLSCAR